MRPDKLERRLRERLDALGQLPAPSCSTSSKLPDHDRADRIGAYWGNPGIRVERGEPYPPRTPERERISGLARQAR